MNLIVIFLTGLTTGGLACLAVQGGLLASVIANQKEQELAEVRENKNNWKAKKRQKYIQRLQHRNFSLASFDYLDWLPVTIFLLSKLVAHTILGFFLGWLGSVFSVSLEVRLFFQAFTALFMFGTAMNLLDVHPVFRFLAFQPPKFIRRLLKNASKSQALFAPAVLGFLTVFIPCGVTQAMEVLAITSGSPVVGALTMFAFVLGTSPLFAAVGVATAKLSESWHQKFSRVAAAVLVIMALYSLNGVLVVLDSPLTLSRVTRPVTYFFSKERFAQSGSVVQVKDGVQAVTISIFNNGYSPNYVKVKKGIPVQLTLKSNNVYSCALAFVLKEFEINTFLKATDEKTFTFTPTKKGKFTFTCSMGMYSGILEVVES
jgi:uncharacterized protein